MLHLLPSEVTMKRSEYEARAMLLGMVYDARVGVMFHKTDIVALEDKIYLDALTMEPLVFYEVQQRIITPRSLEFTSWYSHEDEDEK